MYTGAKSYMYSASESKKLEESVVIPKTLYDATPKTNQDMGSVDLNDKIKYDHNTKEQGKTKNGDKNEDLFVVANSSLILDPYMLSALFFVLVTFTLYPAV